MKAWMVFFAAILAGGANAQHVVKKSITPENSCVLFEIGAVIVVENDALTVLDVMDEADLPTGGKAVDIQSGDQVLMLNGKKITGVKELHDFYDKVKSGTTVKVGLKRGNDLHLVEFQAIDPEARPQQVVIRKRN